MATLIQTRDQIYERTLRYFFAPVAKLLYEDKQVTEVMINGPQHIYCERRGVVEPVPGVAFRDEHALMAAVANLAEFVGRPVDTAHPILDARLPAPHLFRVNVLLPPASRNGISVSIRKFPENTWSLQEWENAGSLSQAAREYLGQIVQGHRNLLISGGTGSGKTSLLNALSGAVPDNERIIVIEDSSELRLQKQHVVYLEARPAGLNGRGAVTVRDLFVNTLRMRPDRIIVGEVRRGEALDMIQGMISGHDGTLSTVHASSPLLALVRLETLCLMADTSLPIYAVRVQIESGVHVIVQVTRFPDGSRSVEHIAEVTGLDADGRYQLEPIFEFVPGKQDAGRPQGELRRTKQPSRFLPGLNPSAE